MKYSDSQRIQKIYEKSVELYDYLENKVDEMISLIRNLQPQIAL